LKVYATGLFRWLARWSLMMALAGGGGWQAHAVNFSVGQLEGQLDSSLSLGFQWATAVADKDLIGGTNGGRGLAAISDDGRKNFKRGETFSKLFKGVHSLELRQADSGVFLRAQYGYDFELMDENRQFKAISTHNRQMASQTAAGELLEAFVYHRYNLVDQPGMVRLGKQVVNWGESVFLQGGVNAINPLRETDLLLPGALLKDALLPVNMLYLSQQLSDSLSLQAFYQLQWEQNGSANCGSFFSQSDILAEGCDDNLALLRSRDALYHSLLTANGGNVAQANSLIDQLAEAGAHWSDLDEGVLLSRHADRDARNTGQWGVALRYLLEPLDTEWTAYAMNYHSRAAFLSALAPTASAQASASALATQLAASLGAASAASLAALPLAGSSGYFVEYPEDIRLYALTFSTRLASGADWRGELSYRPNAPVQLNSLDVLYAGLKGLSIDGSSAFTGVSPLTVASDGLLHGYRRHEITQLQTSLSQPFDQVMGAALLTLVGEVGWTHVGGLESAATVRYGRDPVFGSANSLCRTEKSCATDGFTTRNAWGYRARATWEYPDLWPAVVLKPSLSWSQDVRGYSPAPGGNFEAGRKAISLALDGEYRRTFTARLAYTNFFGGRYSTRHDRDYLECVLGMRF
jgi:hypothetical protein